jgi:hypothetical protein
MTEPTVIRSMAPILPVRDMPAARAHYPLPGFAVIPA